MSENPTQPKTTPEPEQEYLQEGDELFPDTSDLPVDDSPEVDNTTSGFEDEQNDR